MKNCYRNAKGYLRFVVLVVVCVICILCAMSGESAAAKSRVRLSLRNKAYHVIGCEDRIKLLGAPARARIKWRTSNSSILRIGSHRKTYAWFEVRGEGSAVITATYHGRKYKCQISVKLISEPEPDPVADEIGENDESVDSGVGDNTAVDPVGGGLPDESTGGDPPLYERVISDFEERYITFDMTEYQKMDAICRFVSNEFAYEAYQSSWTRMLEYGSGDCFSSRAAVMMIARRIGLRASACMSLDAHGQCIVKADGVIYMTTTGFDEPCPRFYSILAMDDESFIKKAAENHISLEYFGY